MSKTRHVPKKSIMGMGLMLAEQQSAQRAGEGHGVGAVLTLNTWENHPPKGAFPLATALLSSMGIAEIR